MPCAPTVVRATTVLLAGAGVLAACGVAGSTAQAPPQAPSITAVAGARFATPVDLDHGGLLVTPPPAGAARTATVTEREADAMFEATDAVEGPHEFAVFGLGLVTVATRIENPAPTTTTTTTTTTPPAPSTAPPTTAPPTTAPPPPRPTTTTAPPTTAPPPPPTTTATTTPTPTTSSSRRARLLATAPSVAVPPTTAAGVGSPPASALPRYRHRLAWVGIAWGATGACPGSTTTQPVSPDTTAYVAIVIDARTGQRVIAYRSGGSSPCTGTTRTPSVVEPNELLSVPWMVVGAASTAVQIQVPACGHYYGWTQVPTTSGGIADQVVVSVPFDPTCGSTVPQSQAVDQVVPLGAGQGLVSHAPVGPVRALQALPSS